MSHTNPTFSSYPNVPNPNLHPPIPNSTSNLYPPVQASDLSNLVEDPFPDSPHSPSAPPEATEDLLIRIPGAILHLIDREYSVELAIGDFTITVLRQDGNTVVILARVADEIQWPLTRDEAAVKVDDSHYFFAIPGSAKQGSGSESSDDDTKKKGSFRRRIFRRKEKKEDKKEKVSEPDNNVLNYGLTFASKGQEHLLRELDDILSNCSSFSVQKVSENATKKGEVLDGSLAKEISPKDLEVEGKKKEMMEERCTAYWTTLAPNVEDYSSTAAKLIAAGSGQLIKGILWCGDVTVERLKWGNEVLKKRMAPGDKVEIDPSTLKKIKRAKKMTKMSQKMANGVLSGVVRVSGFVTSSVANSSVGKKVFGLLPGEVVLASLDGFNKVCDAVEVAGKNVMSTSSTVTTGLVTHRYGDEAGKAASEGLDAAGHAIGTAWAVFKIRKGLNPKNVLKPSTLAKSAATAAAADAKAKAKSSK